MRRTKTSSRIFSKVATWGQEVPFSKVVENENGGLNPLLMWQENERRITEMEIGIPFSKIAGKPKTKIRVRIPFFNVQGRRKRKWKFEFRYPSK